MALTPAARAQRPDSAYILISFPDDQPEQTIDLDPDSLPETLEFARPATAFTFRLVITRSAIGRPSETTVHTAVVNGESASLGPAFAFAAPARAESSDRPAAHPERPEDRLDDLLTPGQARAWLGRYGLRESEWDQYLSLDGASHQLCAYIRIARGEEPAHFVAAYLRERGRDVGRDENDSPHIDADYMRTLERSAQNIRGLFPDA
jgi:hypothetical protein